MLKFHNPVDEARIFEICKKHYNCSFKDFKLTVDKSRNLHLTILHGESVDSAAQAVISDDNMFLYVSLFPPVNGGKILNYEELYKLVVLDLNILREFVSEKALRTIHIAMADGAIVDNVQVGAGQKPVMANNGVGKILIEGNIPQSIDGSDLNGLKNYPIVRKDQLVGKILPATNGRDGRTLLGETVPKQNVSIVKLKAGENVEQRGDEFYALSDGYASYSEEGELNVLSKIVINDDVTVVNGAVELFADIEINGDVMPGTVIKGNNITVNGMCQNATLIAQNDISVVGIKGSIGRYAIEAGGSITIGHCDNSRLSAKKDIKVNKYSYNSIVNCGNSVIAADETTFTGGTVVSFTGGTFYNVGTESNFNILIAAGEKYFSADAKTSALEKKTGLAESLKKIGHMMQEQKHLTQAQMQKFEETKLVIERRIAELEEVIANADKNIFEKPSFKIKNEIQQGVKVKFFDTALILKETKKKVEFYYNPKIKNIVKKEL